LVPVPGITLAGTYGIELQGADGTRLDRLEYDRVRPMLAALKPQWAGLIESRHGFFLEDKGWTLALHARFAAEAEAAVVLADAEHQAHGALKGAKPGLFRLLGGHRFLEIGPRLANKGLTVAHLLDKNAWPGALPLFLGDDDKDEEAFAVIQERGGIAVLVSAQPRDTAADLRLDSPQAARRWLEGLIAGGE
jgi:trehalose 6-phosphate phosphatase